MPEEEHTLVGQKGITLSGGQKARLSLARALYTDADIYLLDDPISAVDAVVGSRIFYDCILKLKRKNKLVLLVSHQIPYIKLCDRAVVLEGGEVIGEGDPRELNHLFEALGGKEEKKKK